MFAYGYFVLCVCCCAERGTLVPGLAFLVCQLKGSRFELPHSASHLRLELLEIWKDGGVICSLVALGLEFRIQY